MSMIVRDSRTGEVRQVSFSTIQKNGRTLIFPQMMDITDIQDANEIIEIITKSESKFKPKKEIEEREKISKAALKAWAEIWNF